MPTKDAPMFGHPKPRVTDREEVAHLQTRVAKLERALEIIAGGAADQLQRLQATAALSNIGPSIDGA